MNNFLNKFGPGGSMIKRDWWSEQVSGTLANFGVTRDVRDSLQPLVNQGVSLLPKGGAVPAQESSIAAYPQATGYQFSGNINSKMIIGIVVAAIILALIVRRK